MKKSLPFLVLSLLALPMTVQAEQIWNGSECVDIACTEGPFDRFDTLRETFSSPSGGPSAAGFPSETSNSLALDGFKGAESYPTDLPNGSFLYFIEGRVRSVDARSNLLVVKNQRTHKIHTLYVIDPLMNELRERNVVEIWLRPGSDRAERIRRLA